jgi:hypothetical protein
MTPEQQVEKASEMAKVLQKVVKQANLAKKLGGQKEHLEYEAWQTIGQFFNCTPVTEWTRPLKDGDKIMGWEARVNVVNAEGRIIASAESMCMRDEKNWRDKPLYALRSMAQTRTAGKAIRSVFAWVAVLAGYSATPAEEMPVDDIPKFTTPKSVPKKTATGSKFDFLKIMQEHKKELGNDEYYRILVEHGYDHANEITTRDHQVMIYKEMMAAMESGNYPKAQEPPSPENA